MKKLILLTVISTCLMALIVSCSYVSVGNIDNAVDKKKNHTFIDSVHANFTGSDQMVLREIEYLMWVFEGEKDSIYYQKLSRLDPQLELIEVYFLFNSWSRNLDIISGPHTPENEKWNEIQKRMVFCRERFKPGMDYYHYYEDIRAHDFMLKGINPSHIFKEGTCWTSTGQEPGNCELHYYEWETVEGKARRGYMARNDGIAYQIIPHEDYIPSGSALTPADKREKIAQTEKRGRDEKRDRFSSLKPTMNLFPGVERNLRILAESAIFPKKFGGYSLLLSSAIEAKDIQLDSSNHAAIAFSRRLLRNPDFPVELYRDSSKFEVSYRAVREENGSYPLSLLYNLPDSGDYLVVASVENGRGGLGVIRLPITIPSKNRSSDGISDIMLLKVPPQRAYEPDGTGGFFFHNWLLRGMPEATYAPGDSVHLFLEVDPRSDSVNLKVDVYLNSINQKTEVIVEPVEFIEAEGDSIFENPDSTGRRAIIPWRKSVVDERRHYEREKRWRQENPVPKNRVASLLYRVANSPSTFRQSINASFILPPRFKKNSYANLVAYVLINGRTEYTSCTINIK